MIRRKRSTTIAVLICLSLTGVAADLAAQAPELIVEIEKQQIYEGESILYRVTLNHVEKPTAPVLTGFDDFQVAPLGEQSLDSRQITIINGRRTESVRRGRQYNYRLTPRRSGKLAIPAPTAKVGDGLLTGREVVLQVIPPDDQDAVILRFTTDSSIVYPMQPFQLTLTIGVKELPGELKDRDPLSVQPQPPALDAAWLTDNRIPEGLKPERSWREILEPLISRQGRGVQINNIGTSSVFSLFEGEATRFHPPPQRTTRTDANGTEAGYWEYQFQRTIIPQKVGTYEFDPVSLKGTIADDLENGRLVGRRVYVLAPGVKVTVRQVPREGRPDSFIQAVGSFDVKAELAPTSARVGDPLTLTLTLTGQGTLADARPPLIAALPGIDGAFRTYEATEETQSGARRFTYSLRPLSVDVTEFPKIPVSYFNVETEQYVTIHTDPIPVTIRAADVLANSEIVSAPTNTPMSQEKLELRQGGVFANDSSLSSLRNEIVRPARWLASWAGMIVCWVVASLSIRYIERVREDPALLRRRSAAQRAQATLKNAASQLASGSATESSESLRSAVTGLVADFADVPAAGLTPRDTAQRLARLGIDRSLQIRTQELLSQCDAARYGAASDGASRLHTEASDLVGQLVAELRKSSRKYPSPDKIPVGLLLLFGLFSGGCGSTPDLEMVRNMQEAEQSFAAATSPEDFSHVARQYDPMVGDQFASGAALYNQGNAWMRAGETGRAIASYRQAMRYRPRDPYLTANLQNALTSSGRNGEPQAGSKIAGYVFFWQKWLSYPEKFFLATFLLAVTLTSALLGKLTVHRIALHRVALIFGLLWLLAAASTGWDWHRFDRTTYGVVIADQAVARKGNSETYEAAFTHPLTEGTEFVVLERRGDWLLAEVDDSATGWLRERDVEIY